jgi:hypothetical protein
MIVVVWHDKTDVCLWPNRMNVFGQRLRTDLPLRQSLLRTLEGTVGSGFAIW